MQRLSQRNQRVINVLKKRIEVCHKLANIANTESEKDEYYREATAMRSSIWLLTDNEYLSKLEDVYKEIETK